MVLLKRKIPRSNGLTLTYDNACTWMFAAYMASGFLRTLFGILLSKVQLGNMNVMAANIIIYTPFVLLTLLSVLGGKENFGIRQFLFLFMLMLLMFIVTWLMNPSYKRYLIRPVFGAVDSVFRPDFGAIWGFLITVVSKDSKRLYYNFYIGAWFLSVYCIYQYISFLRTGYWTVYNYLGELEKQAYSLDFSYSCCLCACIFLVMYHKKRGVKDLLMCLACVTLMLIGGARGAIACLSVFIFLYYLKEFLLLQYTKKFLVIAVLAAAVFLLYLFMPVIINSLSQVNSRSIQAVLNGTFGEDNGRSQIYEIVREAIKEMPLWGYGPFGDRPFIALHYYWGYSHNLAYEMIMDFGWVIGPVLLVILAVRSIQVYMQAEGYDLAVISILLSANTKLFLSASFWAYAQFWMLLAYLFVIIPVRRRKFKRVKSLYGGAV